MQEVDLRRMFSSRHLSGLFGIKAVIPKERWGCGAAALTSILNHIGIGVNQGQVVDGTETTRATGTPWKGILRYAGKHQVRATITAKTPLIAIISGLRGRKYALLDWADIPGHWVLAVGYDPMLNALAFLDPIREKNPFFAVTVPDFKAMWEGQKSAYPQLMISLAKANREHKTKRGLEERTDFRINSWAQSHFPFNPAQASLIAPALEPGCG